MAELNLPKFTASDAPPEQRMHWVRVPFNAIMELFDAPVLRVQRNHERRALRARHLSALDLPVHFNFLAGRTPDGRIHLIDGYTRLTVLKEGSRPWPAHAWLGVSDVDSKEQLDELYDTVDSKHAVKRGRDAYEEGLRRSGLLGKVRGSLFGGTQVVTAVISAAGNSDVRDAVYTVRNGIRVLDRLPLAAGPGRLPQGALAALLLIASRGGDSQLLERYVMVLEHPDGLSPAEKEAMAPALEVAKSLQHRREFGSLSGKNVGPIMAMVLGGWVALERGASCSTPLSRAEFLALEEEEA